MIIVGDSSIAKTAILHLDRGGTIELGDESEIRHAALLEVGGKYGGSIRIGNHSVVGVGTWIQGSGEVIIGNEVLIGPYCVILSSDHQTDDLDVPIARRPLRPAKVHIGDDVWLGAHVTVLCGVSIGNHAIVGANSLVNRDVNPYEVVVGSPARVIRDRRYQ